MTAEESRLVQLESKLTYQERTIAELNEVVIEQQRLLDALTKRLALMEDALRARLAEQVDPADEPPPPHY